jgi:hypothetical protein
MSVQEKKSPRAITGKGLTKRQPRTDRLMQMGADREGMKQKEFNRRNDGKTSVQNANMRNKSNAHRLTKRLNNGIPV